MAPGDVEVVRQAYMDVNAFMRGDLPGEALAQLLDPQIEWDWNIGLLRPGQPVQRVRGAGELIAFLEQVRAAWAEVSVETVEFIEGPNGQILVHARQERRIPEQGAVVSTDVFHLWTIRKGRVSRLDIYLDSVAAREAAGLPG
jgi:ketosteroid isomerase-like protein